MSVGFRARRYCRIRLIKNFDQAHGGGGDVAAAQLQLNGENAGNIVIRINLADPL